MILGGAALMAAWAMPVASAEAAPVGSAIAAGQATTGDDIAMEMQRRGGRGGGGFRGGRGGGGGGGAAAAAIGLGIMGAIIASEAARANARRDCWIERRTVRDEWGRPLGVRRIRVCR